LQFKARPSKYLLRPYLENTQHKKGQEKWLKWYSSCLASGKSSSTSTTKKKKKEIKNTGCSDIQNRENQSSVGSQGILP
jgi:hypothetical protein